LPALSDERVESMEAVERTFVTLVTSGSGREIKKQRAKTNHRIDSR
jgi:hypothetical protein